MNRDNKKHVVVVSKPLPKLLSDLSTIEQDQPGAVQLVVDKQGTIAATTLKNTLNNKEKSNGRKRL